MFLKKFHRFLYLFLMLFPLLQGCFNQNRLHLLWHTPIASEMTPKVQDGLVYVNGFMSGHPGSPNQLFALDKKTGAIQWTSQDTVYDVYGISGGYVFLLNTARHLVQLNAKTGEKIYESGDDTPPILSWTLKGDTMFIINSSMEVSAIENRQNKVLWRRKLPFDSTDYAIVQLHDQHLIVSGNFRKFGAHFGVIWNLDPATGEERWYYEVPPPHDFAPLSVTVHPPYVLATNTAPLSLQTHVLDIFTGKERYAPIDIFEVYGYIENQAFASNGTFDLNTGKRTGEPAKWIANAILRNGIAWKRNFVDAGFFTSFALRNYYDGDITGRRDWTNPPPCTAIAGFNIKTGKSVFQTKVYKYTQFSAPVQTDGVLYHSSIAMMKEGTSGVWAYKMP